MERAVEGGRRGGREEWKEEWREREVEREKRREDIMTCHDAIHVYLTSFWSCLIFNFDLCSSTSGGEVKVLLFVAVEDDNTTSPEEE